MLALLPFLLALFLFKPHSKHHNFIWTTGFILFVLFLPNAPYLFTDIIHLFEDWQKFTSRQSLFFVTLQYFVLIGLGYWLFCQSYKRFEHFVLRKSNIVKKTWLKIISFTVISIGIYLGRFPRFNSWDAILRPVAILEVFDELLRPLPLLFVFMFTLLLFLVYWIYEWFAKTLKPSR